MSQKKWYYVNASLQRVGPITPQALKALVQNGVIQRNTPLVLEDGSKMIEAGQIQDLFPENEQPSTFAQNIQAPPVRQLSQSAQNPWSHVPVDPFPSGLYSPDPFAAAARQSPFDRTPVAVPSSGPGGLFIGIVVGLVAFLACIVVFVFALSLTRKPTNIAVEANDPFVEVDAKEAAGDNSGGTARSLAAVKQQSIAPSDRNSMIRSPLAHRPTHVEPAPVIPIAPRKERKGKRDTEEIVAETERSVALVNGKMGSGSGFVVLPGIIATNSHVISSENIEEIEVIFPSETDRRKGPFKAQLLYEDRARDLAFLEISSKEHEPLQTVKDYRFRRGQRVIAIGNPGRGDGQILENAVSEGILSTQTDVEGQPFYQLSISINVGNSGGPVLTDEGDVLGIVTLKGAKTEGVAFCIPPDAMNRAIETVCLSDQQVIATARKKHADTVSLSRGIDKLQLLQQVPPARLQDFARETIQDFEDAIRRMPEEAEAYLGRGVCRALLGDVDGTVADFDKAAQLAPERPELAELRNTVRQERDKLRQLASGGNPGHFPLDRLQRFRGGGRAMPTPSEESRPREERYQQILRKETWTFNGKPLRGKLVGYEDGIAHFRSLDDENADVIKRYANRFSREDIADIVYFAQYKGIPLGNLRVR